MRFADLAMVQHPQDFPFPVAEPDFVRAAYIMCLSHWEGSNEAGVSSCAAGTPYECNGDWRTGYEMEWRDFFLSRFHTPCPCPLTRQSSITKDPAIRPRHIQRRAPGPALRQRSLSNISRLHKEEAAPLLRRALSACRSMQWPIAPHGLDAMSKDDTRPIRRAAFPDV